MSVRLFNLAAPSCQKMTMVKQSKLYYGAIPPGQQAVTLLDSSSALPDKICLNFKNYPNCPVTGNKKNFFDYTEITNLLSDGLGLLMLLI